MFGNLTTEFYEIKALFMDRTPIGPFLHSYVSLISTCYYWVPNKHVSMTTLLTHTVAHSTKPSFYAQNQ